MSGKLLWSGLTLMMISSYIHPVAHPVGAVLMGVGAILYLLNY